MIALLALVSLCRAFRALRLRGAVSGLWPGGSVPRQARPLGALLVAALVIGCDSGGGGGPMDPGGDDDDDDDVAVTDAGPAVDGGFDGMPTLAPERAPTPVDVDEWLASYARPGFPDPLLPQALDGSLDVDGPGGIWEALPAGGDGAIPGVRGIIAYAAAVVDLAPGERLMARLDGAGDVFLNGSRQPGDVYRTGRHRLPLAARPGRNVVVFRTQESRGDPTAGLFRTEDALFFNRDDVTRPDLLQGEEAELWVGVPVLNLTDAPVYDLRAEVVGDDRFQATEIVLPALAPTSVTQVPFRLVPAGPIPEGQPDPDPERDRRFHAVRLRVGAPGLRHFYERTVELDVVDPGTTHRRTFRSPMDGSVQYYGVVPPTDPAPGDGHGLVLSLHGAGVEAIGQARAYSAKDWGYIVAPTNRRPFGFDWEAWGRLDALEVFDDARARYPIDETRTHVTGHSMGGHGTWQLGVLFPNRWGVVGPSAGWASFETYGGTPFPDGTLGRARASSDTLAYTDNLRDRAVSIIHGTADRNVPIGQAELMFDALDGVADPLSFHREEGAGHWWDRDPDEPGADCVDWEPMFAQMAQTRRDPLPLDFVFTSPSPGVSAVHSYLTLRSVETPMANVVARSTREEDDLVRLVVDNGRSFDVDGVALRARGVTRIALGADGTPQELPDGVLEVGPRGGKVPDAEGPFHQAFHRPFCFVYPDDGPETYRRYASWLIAQWTLLGNGHACALPLSQVARVQGAGGSLVYLGIDADAIPGGGPDGFTWGPEAVTAGPRTFAPPAPTDDAPNPGIAFLAVFPDEDPGDVGVSAVLATTAGDEALLYRIMPFSSRAGLPDWVVLSDQALLAAGFFAPADWGFAPDLADGL